MFSRPIDPVGARNSFIPGAAGLAEATISPAHGRPVPTSDPRVRSERARYAREPEGRQRLTVSRRCCHSNSSVADDQSLGRPQRRPPSADCVSVAARERASSKPLYRTITDYRVGRARQFGTRRKEGGPPAQPGDPPMHDRLISTFRSALVGEAGNRIHVGHEEGEQHHQDHCPEHRCQDRLDHCGDSTGSPGELFALGSWQRPPAVAAKTTTPEVPDSTLRLFRVALSPSRGGSSGST